MNSLRLENLRKEMGSFCLEASFEVSSADRVAVVGRSGIGKTTLLRLIAGLETGGGRIWLGGADITALPVHRREIAFVFQEQALFDGRSVRENVGFGLKMRGVAPDRRVLEWLDRLGLSERADESVDHLSGGERQRVALARALIIRPKLILMDEPFTGLDPELRAELCDEVVRLHVENPVPMLFVSHDERDLARVATGKLVFEEAQGVRRVKLSDHRFA